MKRWMLMWVGLWLSLGVAGAVVAAGAVAPLATDLTEAQARRFHALAQELRCVVCQNESLADSTAPLAQDLKQEIRTRMAAGQSDAEIKTFLVDRYGHFVNYRPPVNPATYLLWAGPVLFLLLGVVVVLRHIRRGSSSDPSKHAPPSNEARP